MILTTGQAIAMRDMILAANNIGAEVSATIRIDEPEAADDEFIFVNALESGSVHVTRIADAIVHTKPGEHYVSQDEFFAKYGV